MSATVKTILIGVVAIAIASIVIRVSVLKRPADQELARENAERNANFERASNQPEPLPAPVVDSIAPGPISFQEITNSRESKPLAKSVPTDTQTKALPEKVLPQATPVPRPRDEIQDPLARVALSLVGDDPEAEQYWLQAINNPNLSAHERKDLIEDLNEDGLSDPRNPTVEDLPLIVNRILIIEEIAPDAIDQVNADAFQEAYKDLANMYVRLTTP